MKVRHLFLLATLLSMAMSLSAKEPENFYADKSAEAYGNLDADKAVEFALLEIKHYKKNPNGYFRAGNAYYMRNDFEEAVKMYDRGIKRGRKKYPDLVRRCYEMKSFILQNEMKDTTAALATLDEALKLFPDNEVLLLGRFRLTENFAPEIALQDLDKMIELHPDDGNVYKSAIYMLRRNQRPEAALMYIDRALSNVAGKTVFYTLRAQIEKDLGLSPDWIRDMLHAYALGDADAAIDAFADVESDAERLEILREIDTFESEGYTPVLARASCLVRWNQPLDAIEALVGYIDEGGDDPVAIETVVNIFQANEDHFSAYHYANIGLKNYPDYVGFFEYKVVSATFLGQGAKMLDEIDAYADKHLANRPGLTVLKGDVLMALGRYDDALVTYRSTDSDTWKPMMWLKVADALRMSGRKDEADEIYNSKICDVVIEEAYDVIDRSDLLSFAYSASGRIDMAIRESALSGSASYADIARLYARSSDRDKTIESLLRAVEDEVMPYSILADFNFHFLHSDPEFRALLDRCEIPTREIPETGLLAYRATDDFYYELNGTSMEDLDKAIARNPDDWVRITNSMCPVDMGDEIQMSSVTYNAMTRTITRWFTVGEGSTYFMLLNDPKYIQKSSKIKLNEIIRDNPALADMDVTVLHVYTSRDKKQKKTLTYTAAQLKRERTRPLSRREIDNMTLELYEYIDNLGNDEHRYPDSEILMERSVYAAPMYITTLTVASDEIVDRASLFKDDMKNSIARMLRTDPVSRGRIPVHVRTATSRCYVITNPETGARCEIIFTPDELEQLLD